MVTLLGVLILSANHVLMIGIDGMRTDALEHAPNIQILIAKGSYSKQVCLAPDGDTVSGVGWSTILTGQEHHGIMGNGDLYDVDFDKRHKKTFLAQIPNALVIGDWPGLVRIVGPDSAFKYVDREVAQGTMERRRDVNADAVVAAEAQQELEGGASFLFTYFLQVDGAGHGYGFGSPEYAKAVARVDAHVGTLVQTVDKLPGTRQDRWLIVVLTDHGGTGDGHSKGHGKPEVDLVWVVLFGDGVSHKDMGPMRQADIAPYVLGWYSSTK